MSAILLIVVVALVCGAGSPCSLGRPRRLQVRPPPLALDAPVTGRECLVGLAAIAVAALVGWLAR